MILAPLNLVIAGQTVSLKLLPAKTWPSRGANERDVTAFLCVCVFYVQYEGTYTESSA